MPTPFADRDAKLDAAVNRAFGEVFTFSAMKISGNDEDVNLPKSADNSRQAFSATGAFEKPSKSSVTNARGSIADDNAHSWAASMPSVSIADVDLPWTPRTGDRATRQHDGAVYEIGNVYPDGMGRTLFVLGSKKR